MHDIEPQLFAFISLADICRQLHIDVQGIGAAIIDELELGHAPGTYVPVTRLGYVVEQLPMLQASLPDVPPVLWQVLKSLYVTDHTLIAIEKD